LNGRVKKDPFLVQTHIHCIATLTFKKIKKEAGFSLPHKLNFCKTGTVKSDIF